MKKDSENRRFRRSRDYGPQRLTLLFRTPEGRHEECHAKLWDFSEGGLGMDSPRSFQAGEVIEIRGNLRGAAYSMGMVARARVAYCRQLDKKVHRVGVAFLDVSYHRIVEAE